MKINSEYPKFYMRVENKRYAALPTSSNACYIYKIDGFIECSFLSKEIGNCESNFFCTKNKVIYVEVREEQNEN